MGKLYKINIFHENKLVTSSMVEAGAVDPLQGSALFQVQPGSVVELVDPVTGKGAKKVIVRRIGDDLEIMFDNESPIAEDGSEIPPDIVLEGFYGDARLSSTLLGIGESGLHSYATVEGREAIAALDTATTESSSLLDQLLSPETAPYGMGWYALGLPIAAAAVAISNSGGGGSSSGTVSDQSVKIVSVDNNNIEENAFLTNTLPVVLNGTLGRALREGEKLQFKVSTGSTWRDVEVENGKTTWSYTDTLKDITGDKTEFEYQEITVQFRVVDSSGTLIASASQAITLDNMPPPDTVKPEITGIEGAAGFVTDKTEITLTGKLTAPLASRERLQILLKDGTWETITVAQGATEWTYTDKGPLDPGNHAYKVRIIDTAGNLGQTDEKTVTVLEPGMENHISIETINDEAIVDGEVFINQTAFTLKGTIALQLKDGYRLQIQLVDKDGNPLSSWENLLTGPGQTEWIYDTSGLTDGPYYYHLRVADTANESVASAEITVEIDTLPPEAIISIDSINDGAPGYFATDETSVTIKGSLDQALGEGEKIQVRYNTDGVWSGWVDVAIADGATEWSYTDPRELEANGQYTYEVRVVDRAGNVGDDDSQKVSILPPGRTNGITIDAIDPDTNIPDDFVTKEDSFTIKGTILLPLGANDKVQIWVDNAWQDVIVSAGDTTWSYAFTSLPDGKYVFKVQIVDRNNKEIANDEETVTVDTTPPSADTTVAIEKLAVANEERRGFAVNKSEFTVKGSLGAALESDETLQIRVNSDRDEDWVTVTVASGATAWSYLAEVPDEEGSYLIEVRVIDTAGNVGEHDQENVELDLTPPTTSIKIDAINNNDAGVFETNQSSIVLRGSLGTVLQEGEVAQISLNGVDWIDLDIPHGVDQWTYTDSKTFAHGNTAIYKVRVIDQAGNVSNGADQVTVKVDMEDPTARASIRTFEDDVEWFTGDDFESGTITNDVRPKLIGIHDKLNTGEYIVVYRDGEKIGNATLTTDGWYYQETADLASGEYIYKVQVVDKAGNKGPMSGEFTIVVDATPPGSEASILSFTDSEGSEPGDYGSGTTTIDTLPKLNGQITQPLSGEWVEIYCDGKAIGKATMNTPTTWSFQLPENLELADGEHIFSARVVTSNGNEQQTFSEFTIIVDTGAFISTASDDVFDMPVDAHQTVLFRLLDKNDAAGGNGSDILNDFTVGDYTNDPGADRIDLRELLAGVDSESLDKFLKVETDGTNTVISIDRDGDGKTYDWTTLVTLTDVHTDLETLLANNQLMIL